MFQNTRVTAFTFSELLREYQHGVGGKKCPPPPTQISIKGFSNDSFTKYLQILITKSFNVEAIPFQALRESMSVTLEKHAPTKK